MDNTLELVTELAAYKNVSMREARVMIGKFYGKSERTVYDWTLKGGIYEYGMILEAVKQIKEGEMLHSSLGNRYKAIKQAYHDYEGYSSGNERAVMMFFAFECMDGEKVFGQTELLARLKIARSSLYDCIARLEEKGMLKREKLKDGSGARYWI